MDWHFRRNRKERETEGRGAHRRWLPRADEWIHENSEAGPSEPKQEAVASTKLTAERLAKATIPCPICKEQFKSEWSEDEEEWVFNNAINVHGTVSSLPLCRADARSSTLRAAPRR
jgi:pre-mRNA cleavage complex 2 protein Pcf11